MCDQEIEEWSNLSAYQIGLDGNYNHKFKNVSLKEILKRDSCIVSDGVGGGSGSKGVIIVDCRLEPITIDKPNVSKGGQNVQICNAHHVQARVYCHSHKYHTKLDRWSASDIVEARKLSESFASIVDGADTQK